MYETLPKPLLPLLSPNPKMFGWLNCQIPATQWQDVSCLYCFRSKSKALISYISLRLVTGGEAVRKPKSWFDVAIFM